MEVTLEKIELVKDRTGVTYKEAKEALEACDGNVVDAIVSIEDKTDGQTKSEKIGAKGNELIDKIKEVVNRGNVARILIKKDEELLLNLPLNAGVVGAVVAPWGIILGVAAAFGFKCKIELIKDDGEVVDITDKAGNIYEQAREKGEQMYEQMREKAPGAFDAVREKGEEALNKAQQYAKDAKEKFAAGKDKAEEAADDLKDKAEEAADDLKDKAEGLKDKAEEVKDEIKEEVESIKEEDL